MKRIAAAAAVLAVAAIAAGTIAWAAAGDTPTINACVASANGMVRIPQNGDACRNNESAVQWSVQGPQGLQGAPGPQGPKGDAGQAVPDEHTSGIGTLTVEGTKQGAFKNAISVLGFDYTVKSPRDVGSGQATGKRQHSPVTFVKRIDATTPQLFQALTTNEVLKKVVLELPDGQGGVDYRITLKNAGIVSDRQYDLGKSEQPSREAIEVVFQTIEIESVSGKTMAVDSWSTQP